MSVPDRELDEPSDDELCTSHYRYRPCRECRDQADIERGEALKEA